MWIRNTAGEKSASLTLVLIVFVIMMAWMILSIFFAGPFGIAIMPFDAADAMMVFSPIAALYWGRRNTDTKSKIIASGKENK